MKLTDQKYVRELLEKYSLSPKKAFGQNFLVNEDVPRRIAAASACGYDLGAGAALPDCDAKKRTALEIGPGIGAMTRYLSEFYKSVIAVEIDRGLIPLLGETLDGCDNVTVINDDFMKCSLDALLGDDRIEKADVCANLPYYITTPILMKLLESCPAAGGGRIESVTMMIQSEVADRICAAAGSAEYGSITASVALHGKAKRLFTVSPGCFYPAPKVSSAVVRIELYENGIYDVFADAPKDSGECEAFAVQVKNLIAGAFEQRRKTLTNALSGKYDKKTIAWVLEEMGLRSDIRGEKLSAQQFCMLYDKISG